MANAQGASVYVMYGKESTAGTPVTRTKAIEPLNAGVRVERSVGYSRTIRGLDPQRSFTRRLRGVGPFGFEMFFAGIEELLRQCTFGSKTTTIVSGAYRHEFARTTDTGVYAAVPAGLSFEQHVDIENYLFTGVKCGQAVLSFPVDEMPSVAMDLVAMSGALNGTPTDPTGLFPSDTHKITPDMITVTIDGTNMSIDARNVEATIGNAIDGERGRYGSINPKEAVRSGQRPDCMVRLELDYTDVTKGLVAKLISGASVSVKVAAAGAAIGATGQNLTYMFEAPNCTIEEGFPAPGDSGQIPLSLSLKAMPAAASAFTNTGGLGNTGYKVTLINANSTY